jgi:hypothetical protein
MAGGAVALGTIPVKTRNRQVHGMSSSTTLREHVAKLLAWEDAHVGFEAAVADLPASLRGKQPPGLPYSPWQLLEHLRITQRDILDFCTSPHYVELAWPDDYWPDEASPPGTRAWEDSIQQFRRDREALQALSRDTDMDLEARVPQGSGQIYLRELLLAADHTAYHVGELIVVRRLLGAWPSSAQG